MDRWISFFVTVVKPREAAGEEDWWEVKERVKNT